MWVSTETIYQSLYVQSRGALRRELTAHLRTGRALRSPSRKPGQRKNRIPDMVNISLRPAEADDRAVPGHAGEAAKAQKKVHDAETKLRAEEQLEARKAEEKRRAAEKKAIIERERVDSRRESAQRKQMARLRTQIEDQARLLAAAPWDQTPETITVLFVASSPEDQDGLRIDKEMREIQQKVRMADHRDALRFQYAVAAQPADLLQRLNEVKPDIVHFSGHSGSAGLAMEDNDGLTRYLSTDELATLLSVTTRRIRLAVFKACESAEHAASALNHLDAAIGMEQSIDDEAAKSFAGQLYGSIAFGLPLRKAFNQAVLQVRLLLGEDSGEPRIHVADGLDPDELYLVRPATNT
jgi:hypothetical protein